MKIDLPTVGVLFRAEMRMIVRDRRAMLASVFLPLLVMPLLLFGSSWANRQREKTLETSTFRYAIAGPEAAAARAIVEAALAAPASPDSGDGKDDGTSFSLEEVRTEDAPAGLAAGELHFIVEGLSAEDARAEGKTDAAGAEDGGQAGEAEGGGDSERRETFVTGAPVVRLVFRADRDDSQAGQGRMADRLRAWQQAERSRLLAGGGLPLAPDQVSKIVEADVATEAQVAGLTLGRALTLFLLILLLPSAAVVATDSIAGERERGTLETLLTTAAGRLEIVVAKHLSVLAVAMAITLIQAANLLVYVGLHLIPLPPGLAAAVTPGVAALLLLLYLPLTLLVASVLLLTSGRAKSYKEAQLYFTPIYLLGLLPALAPFLPGLSLRSAIVLVPVANISVAVRDVLVGSFDWPMLALAWMTTSLAAVWATRRGVRVLSAEALITASENDAADLPLGPALFGRHVLRWFAALWAVLLVVNNYLGNADIRVQVAVNVVGLFFGASLLMIWRYRLDARAALALRAPRPAVWLAVLVAAPATVLCGAGLARLVSLFLSVSPGMMESFMKALLPEDMPWWQIVLFLALLPGIFEEIAFRGVLLHGLHRRLHPAAVALAVGAIFGFVHIAFFRLVPTTFLGILFATATLLTGSIFPAMVWHALNNLLALLAERAAIPLGDLDPATYLAAAGALAAALWIMWRNRTPYPGLRPWRRTVAR